MLVVDRNHPVARVSTVGSHVVSQEGALIRDLERRGLILPATKQMKSKKWIALRLVKAKGVSAVEALLQEREESM